MDKINWRLENDEEQNDLKQKVEEEKAKKHDVASHFQTIDKKLRKKNKKATKSRLKNSSRIENETDFTTRVNATTKKTYLCLALETPTKRDYISGNEKVVGKLVDEQMQGKDAVVMIVEENADADTQSSQGVGGMEIPWS